MTERVAWRLRIAGRVQGVWFRDSMQREARRLQVDGWVRNSSDGTVEAVVTGHKHAVEALVAWSRRGPPHAEVASVEVGEHEGEGSFTSFEKRPDS